VFGLWFRGSRVRIPSFTLFCGFRYGRSGRIKTLLSRTPQPTTIPFQSIGTNLHTPFPANHTQIADKPAKGSKTMQNAINFLILFLLFLICCYIAARPYAHSSILTTLDSLTSFCESNSKRQGREYKSLPAREQLPAQEPEPHSPDHKLCWLRPNSLRNTPCHHSTG